MDNSRRVLYNGGKDTGREECVWHPSAARPAAKHTTMARRASAPSAALITVRPGRSGWTRRALTRRPKPYIRQHVPKKGIIGAVIAVIIVIMAIHLPRYTALNFGSLVGGKEELTPNYGWEQEAPAEEIESTVREYAEIGASFYLEDSAFAVASLKADWEEDILTVYVVEGDTYQTFPYLVIVGDDGFEDWNYPYDVSAAVDEHVFVCAYDLSVLEDLTGDTSLIFSGFDKEVAVPVDLAQW